jgi:hypothetical protein
MISPGGEGQHGYSTTLGVSLRELSDRQFGAEERWFETIWSSRHPKRLSNNLRDKRGKELSIGAGVWNKPRKQAW